MPKPKTQAPQSLRIIAKNPFIELKGGTDLWWQYFEEYKEYQPECNEKPMSDRLNAWVSNTRKSWQEGKLSEEQIMALRETKFRFNTPLRYLPGAKPKGKKLDLVLRWKEILDDGGTLSEKDKVDYIKAINSYSAAYRSGQLSERSAQRLGIV